MALSMYLSFIFIFCIVGVPFSYVSVDRFSYEHASNFTVLHIQTHVYSRKVSSANLHRRGYGVFLFPTMVCQVLSAVKGAVFCFGVRCKRMSMMSHRHDGVDTIDQAIH